MRLSQIRKIGNTIIGAHWIGDLPLLPGVELHVMSAGHPAARHLASRMISALPMAKRMDPAEIDRIESAQVQEFLLVGWRGLADDDGAEIEFSREKLAELMADPEISAVLVDSVRLAADRIAVMGAKEIEADLKN